MLSELIPTPGDYRQHSTSTSAHCHRSSSILYGTFGFTSAHLLRKRVGKLHACSLDRTLNTVFTGAAVTTCPGPLEEVHYVQYEKVNDSELASLRVFSCVRPLELSQRVCALPTFASSDRVFAPKMFMGLGIP